MNPLVDKLADLAAQRAGVLSQARAITDKPQLSVDDRRQFEEFMELISEIENYADRLQRRNEKWRRI
jgi:hypothetical protein